MVSPASQGRLGAAAGTTSGSGLVARVFLGKGIYAPPARLDGDLLSATYRMLDTDGDGLPDYADDDNDNDNLSDHEELAIENTDPNDRDTDNDALEDGEEVHVYGTDPTRTDTDNDGTEDGWEVAYSLDPTDSTDADADKDGDGFSNRQEFLRETDPEEYALRLAEGWNLVSLSRVPTSHTPQDIFQGHIDGKAWCWDEEQSYYVEPEELLPLLGYWVYANTPLKITIQLPNSVVVVPNPLD